MKWGIVVLLILGVVAAACAALLVAAMGGGSSAAARGSQGLEVVVAKRSLPAMTVVTVDDFVKQKVSRNELPKEQLSSPTRVVGRILSVPVVEGQILTESCFVSEGTGAQLVAAIPDGMRLLTLSLSGRAVPDPLLLYPGSIVDVLFSFKLPRDTVGEAACLTILSGLQVVVVQGQSVVSNPEQEGKAKTRRAGGNVQVTLLVEQKQAEALQVLADTGNISLVIRNPLDKTTGDMQTMVLSQGQLARLSSLLTAEGVATPQKQQEVQEWLAAQLFGPKDPNQATQTNPGPSVEGNGATRAAPAGQPQSDLGYRAPKRPRWGVDVIRGRETKTEEFDSPGGEAATFRQGVSDGIGAVTEKL